MKIKEFQVSGLFDLYNHKLDFSNNDTKSAEETASVIMIYGKNGIGKTTILRMIDGLMTLNFDEFRTTKFKNASLTFSGGNEIYVEKIYKEDEVDFLNVKYRNLQTKLHPLKSGPKNKEDSDNESEFIKLYNDDLDKYSYEFIDTERLIRKNIKDEMLIDEARINGKIIRNSRRDSNKYLENKVREFIRNSQVNFSNYFRRTEPELFDKILENLESNVDLEATDLLNRLKSLISSEKKYKINELGLRKENWNKKKLEETIKKSNENQNKLTIISSYIEVLESRNLERMSLAERLLNFEKLLNEFLTDKVLSINSNGFILTSKNKNKDILNETQLSTGEYHLLYLTTLALSTKAKGTVIAIDEPEMSMHISWQRKLIKALVQISSKASPQMIFATHSPDIASNYTNSLTTELYDFSD